MFLQLKLCIFYVTFLLAYKRNSERKKQIFFFTLLRMHLTRFLGGILPNEEQDTLEVYGQLILEEAKKQVEVIDI
ncbi:MAG: hypothetical protein KKB77_04135 [Bacteroidetes bacterium]|nr:hypothetical protein [Bacteroidota bacterium]